MSPPYLLLLLIGLVLLLAVFGAGGILAATLFLIIGVGLIIFAPRIGRWWTDSLYEERRQLAEKEPIKGFRIPRDVANIILFDFGGRSANVWAFRLYGLVISGFSAYRLLSSLLR